MVVTRFYVFVACLAMVILYLGWRIGQLRDRVRRLEFEGPLREVITVSVELRPEFFSEALKLPREEISRSSEMVRAIWLRLQIWKDHYTGEIAFYARFGEEPLGRSSICEFPTDSFQFPLELARCVLFGKALDRENRSFDFGPTSSEKLVVLLSQKALVIRARDGRFDWIASSGHCYKPSPSDLLIPIREDDLDEFLDNYGHDDPDWLQMKGLDRHYKRDGRWANWRITALYPESLSWTTAHFDKSAVKPND